MNEKEKKDNTCKFEAPQIIVGNLIEIYACKQGACNGQSHHVVIKELKLQVA